MVLRGAGFSQGRQATIAVSSDFYYGLARMFEALAPDTGADREVFRDLRAAREWLTGTPAKM